MEKSLKEMIAKINFRREFSKSVNPAFNNQQPITANQPYSQPQADMYDNN